MLSLFSTEPASGEIHAGPEIRFEEAAEASEFEIVLGRRQLASVLFVGTVAMVVFSSIAYLAGKSVGPAPKTVIQRVVERIPAPVPAPGAAPAAKPEAALFAEPRTGQLYLQMGAVEKGIAVVFAEGLRKHGFEAIVASGPNDHIFRVLIGPLADNAAYEKTREETGRIGLNTFARKFPQ